MRMPPNSPPAPDASVRAPSTAGGFRFERDTLAFANETKWDYSVDEETGQQVTEWRDPVPDYTLRCLVLVRVVKQFFLHARFDPDVPPLDEADCAARIKRVLRGSPRAVARSNEPVIFPGFAGLRDFSAAHQRLLKRLCGGAWRSYVQRGNWRMVLPIWRAHQAHTAKLLAERLATGVPQAVHVFRFPQLTINHALLAYASRDRGTKVEFETSDPNLPDAPLILNYEKETRRFTLPPTIYFKGGQVEAYCVYRNLVY